jgi:hypothetical protein
MDSNLRKIYSDKYYRQNKWMMPFVGKLTKPKSYQRFFVQARACLSHNAYEKLPQIQLPTLILGGEKGCICSLCVTPASGLGCLFSAERTVIAWERIRCIGRDTVLVDVAPEECCKNRCGEGQGWRKRFSRKS